MNFIKDTTWDEVFEAWKQRESKNPDWIRCATEIKGWPDWESWRKYSTSQIQADQRKWKLYELTNPIIEIPTMLVGPYSGWQSRLPQKNIFTFDELIKIPEQYKELSGHKGIVSILEGLPFSTEMIGIIREDNNKIICFEGHHRAIAITLAKKQKKDIDFSNTKIIIALTHLPINDIHLIDEMLERGSSKNPER